MPNTSVQAAAEGLPKINRRMALTMLSGGVIAVAATATIASPPPSPTGLHDALSACYAAEDAYSICQARETSIAEALGGKLFPKWATPGGIASRWSHVPMVFRTSKALEEEIERKREMIEKSFAGGMMNRLAYDGWMHDIEAQGAEGLASLREQEAVIAASGYHEAYKLSDEAFYTARDAFQAVLVLPCQTIEEVRAKAACILRVYGRLGLEIDGDDFTACLTSLCEEM